MNDISSRSKAELTKEIKDRLKHFYGKTDGTYSFPNSLEGDMLKMVLKLVEHTDELC